MSSPSKQHTQVPKMPPTPPQSMHDIQQSSLYGNVKKKKKEQQQTLVDFSLLNGSVISLCFRYEAQTS